MEPVKEMMMKGTDSGTTWIGFWIEQEMDIDVHSRRSKQMDRR